MESSNSLNSIQAYYAVLLTINFTLSITVMLLACLFCCKRKVPKNDLLGLEGMVKLKNPDEVVIVATGGGASESQADLNVSTISNADSEKRASTAAHRSLPDIPMVDTNGDNGSELYETVAEKRLGGAENNPSKSPTLSLKKQMSISQHSSISQADDVSSPYSRVKNSSHDYAKVRTTEHPYAQLNAPSNTTATTSTGANNHSEPPLPNGTINRISNNSDSIQDLNAPCTNAEIPAASAIAGMISASQDLPYMTPPIANQHFSGDSQDSSKGYTSISVREPLANILAQQPIKSLQRNTALTRDMSDSHYATVSDDSDETYAAIENPHATGDIYTSGSETYAQIQPMQPIVVAAEINHVSVPSAALPLPQQLNTAPSSTQSFESNSNVSTHFIASHNNRIVSDHTTPIPPPVDTLRTQKHSRQASQSSNNSSSMGNLGSPKPEKRQANSPLPPTPKSNASQHQLLATASGGSNITSGRSSIISVVENNADGNSTSVGSGSTTNFVVDNSPQKKHKSLSPSKDIEGMYAKVVKKNKFSRNSPSSQNNSPVLSRRANEDDHPPQLGVSPLDSTAAHLIESQKISMSNIGNRTRSNSDHGYETIPADSVRAAAGAVGIENRKSDCYSHFLQKERQQDEVQFLNLPQKNTRISLDKQIGFQVNIEKHYETIANSSDPGYETLLKPTNQIELIENEKKSSDYDPNYEVLKCPDGTSSAADVTSVLTDDGYAKVLEKNRFTNDTDSTDGYSKVRGEENEDGTVAGYSTIAETKASDTNHNYASILETKTETVKHQQDDEDEESDHHYARIAEAKQQKAPDLPLNSLSSPAKLYDIDVLSPQPTDLPITSPSSINSSSILNNSSALSSTPVTSTGTISSRQTPSSSQYESFTGSDTDPNYESVAYFHAANNENPYQRLQTDYSDAQLNSPQTPIEIENNITTRTTITETKPKSASKTTTTAPNGGTKTQNANDATVAEIVVDDYFQV